MKKEVSFNFDEALILEVASHNIDALKEIYETTKEIVFRVALSITKNKEDAEDVLHDTFIKVYEKAHTYTKTGKPVAWVCTIARNEALMKLRKKKRITLIDYSDTIKYSYSSNDDKLILESAFKVLTEDELQIVLLYAIEGLKHQEIADTLNMKLATVLSKYHRSLKKMFNFLEGAE